MNTNQRQQIMMVIAGIDLVTLLALAPFYCSKKVQDDEISQLASLSNEAHDILPYHTQEEGEAALRENILRFGYEQAFLYDGTVWYNVDSLETEHSVYFKFDDLLSLVIDAPDDVVYFYHSHNGGNFGAYTGVNPLSSNDLLLHAILNQELHPFGKRLISRVVESNGIWEYETAAWDGIPEPEFYNNFFAFMDPSNPYSLLQDGIHEVLHANNDDLFSKHVYALQPLYQAVGATITFTPIVYTKDINTTPN